ncbi:MAG: glycosyltransferase [Clostridiales bacterium]|nr:glycosyltransferase [Clostridiales bacterium]
MKLILIGEDVDSKQVREKVDFLGIADKVIITGRRTDIPQLLSAMDIMIFPSLFEALPVSLIETQASKLPCLISDMVTQDVKFNDNVEFMSLNENPQKWADKAFELLDYDRNSVSTEKLVKNYEISYVTETLDRIYGI